MFLTIATIVDAAATNTETITINRKARVTALLWRKISISDRGASASTVSNVSIPQSTLNERLESQVDYMWSEYELTYSRAEELRKEELTSIPEMKRSINEKKMEIRALGNVNVNAIEHR